eukprot:Plantae.Rhodophyta-Palmaria_palmata.ctg12325.p1 GENE.Plantae.Rhodophyta-Palmaria_palmata.ctg12325~~Plantae.Rhodophyta-Palmaria_palmata.ctg12325.p1  ORF type:complete len:118 (-),score=6.63 Plantae.Rhodophyta-Palmaria_palmata.ctg12325:930-1283(-)
MLDDDCVPLSTFHVEEDVPVSPINPPPYDTAACFATDFATDPDFDPRLSSSTECAVEFEPLYFMTVAPAPSILHSILRLKHASPPSIQAFLQSARLPSCCQRIFRQAVLERRQVYFQ